MRREKTSRVMHAKDDCIDIGATFLESARRISSGQDTFENAPFLIFLSLEPFFLLLLHTPNRLKINCAKRQHEMRLLR